MKYRFHEFFDQEGDKPIELNLNFTPVVGTIFELDDVEYQIDHLEGHMGIIKMIRYKVANTATQIVHKCPAIKNILNKMDRDDVVSFNENITKNPESKKSRIRFNSHNKLNVTCPHCNVIFYKNENVVPERVTVEGVMNGNRKRNKRSKSNLRKQLSCPES